VLGVLTGVVLACTPVAPPAHIGGVDPDLAPRATEAAYAAHGPFDVGVLTVEVEPGRRAEVWYPAPEGSAAGHAPDTYHLRDALPRPLDALLPTGLDPSFTTEAVRSLPAAPGRFPMVLFSHGFGSFRNQSTMLTTHLASWGFVVLSPDYIERGLGGLWPAPGVPNRPESEVVDLTVAAAKALDVGPGLLAGRIDTSRLFPVGHSAGGWSSSRMAGERTDVSSWISLSFGLAAPAVSLGDFSLVPLALDDPHKAGMWITGADDRIVPLARVQDAYGATAGERKLVVVPRSGHNNAMTDLCEIGRDEGGLVGLAASAGLWFPQLITELAQDGCLPPAAPSAEAWPVVRHFVTAELRYRAGLDPEPVGLGSRVVDRFGDMAPTYLHDE
jgi:dienelactone hydrolase